jgi:hypothetical protein
MEDKRIKQAAAEMVIAWGMICIGFYVYDLIFQNLNIAVIKTGNSSQNGIIYYIAYFSIVYSILPALYTTHLCFNFMLPFEKSNVLVVQCVYLVVPAVLQFFLYWYLGNLTGRLIVWLKHLRNKTESPPEDKSFFLDKN